MIRIAYALGYLIFIVKEVLASALRIAADVCTPGLRMAPGIVRFPLRCTTDLEVTMLTSSITITPGTLVLGIASPTADAPGALFVHAVYGRDRDALLADLADMEQRLLRVTRGPDGARSAGYRSSAGREVQP